MYSVADLHQYYQSDEGVKTAQHLAMDIAALWSPAEDEIAAAVGFPFPFLANRHLPPVLMPNTPGAACWQGRGGVISAQIDLPAGRLAVTSLTEFSLRMRWNLCLITGSFLRKPPGACVDQAGCC